jgi:hypothetical protein
MSSVRGTVGQRVVQAPAWGAEGVVRKSPGTEAARAEAAEMAATHAEAAAAAAEMTSTEVAAAEVATAEMHPAAPNMPPATTANMATTTAATKGLRCQRHCDGRH